MLITNEADNAEISWRTGFCIRFKAAMAVDVMNRYGTEAGKYTLGEAARLYREVEMLIRLSDSLESRMLKIHPLVSGRKDVIEMATECMDICGPATRYEIHKYFNMNKPSMDLLRWAYLAAPWSRRLRYEFCSCKLFNIQAVVTVDSLSSEEPWWAKDRMYFTTHTGMAIGHYATVIDFLELCLREKWSVEVWIMETGSDVDFGVKNMMIERYPNVRFCSASVVELMTLEELSALQDAHFRHYWMNSKERAQTSNSLKTIRTKKHVSMHLRSSSFRNDINNPATNIRSVIQNNYQTAVDALAEAGYEISQITAEPSADKLKNTQFINVSTMPFEAQWVAIQNSSFILGTPSGISHFSALTSFATLMTNWTGMPSENILGEYTLVACKRFTLKKEIVLMRRSEVLSLFVNFWINKPIGLADLVEIRDLNGNELKAATQEYMTLINGYWHGDTLHDIIKKYRIGIPTSCIQNWKLAESTAADLKVVLDFCKDVD